MRSTKFTKLSAILLGASLTAGVLGIATACGHEHTFASEYTKTEYEHYYAAECEHETEKKDVGGHDKNGTNGACSVCGYLKEAVASFAYEEVEGGIEITAYTGDPMDEVTIPATIDGKKVVAIADDALTVLNEEPEAKLDSLKQIKTIKFDAEVTSIGKRNFVHMAALKTVTIPTTVATIGEGCFTNNSQLTTVTITSGEVNLGSDAFSYNPKLDTITLPADLVRASASSFKNCSSELEIIYADSTAHFNAFTYDAMSSLKNATVTARGDATGATESEGGFTYALNEDNNSYTIVALTADIISETSTEIYLPQTYKDKNVTGIAGFVFNAYAYRDEALIEYLANKVTVIDVNTAFQAKDTKITSIGNHNFVGMQGVTRTTLPAEIVNETVEGWFVDYGATIPATGPIAHFRIPEGVKVMKNCFNWGTNPFFNNTTAYWLSFNMPSTLERYEGKCWVGVASTPGIWMYNQNADTENQKDADTVAKDQHKSVLMASKDVLSGGVWDYFMTLILVPGEKGEDNRVIFDYEKAYDQVFVNGNGGFWVTAGQPFLMASYQAVIDAGY